MHQKNMSRRTLLQQAAYVGGALAVSRLGAPRAAAAENLKSRIGLALYTVQDLMDSDFEGVLAKIAQIGYKEIEPANGYNNKDAKAFRALLDGLGLSMPSTHTNYPEAGADMERQLEAQQIMGIRYTEIRQPRPAGAAPARPAVPPGAYFNPGTGKINNSFTELGAFGPYQPPVTLDATKKRAATLNANGKIARKFGIKLFVHNHTGECEKLSDDDRCEYDILLAETDPELVTMQLDIAWASISGKDPIQLFKANPGRYELWHIKDVFGLQTVNPALSPNQRISNMAFAPVGMGQIDYKKIFAAADVAGLKHFVVEQDNAATFGDSLAAAGVSYKNLSKILG